MKIWLQKIFFDTADAGPDKLAVCLGLVLALVWDNFLSPAENEKQHRWPQGCPEVCTACSARMPRVKIQSICIARSEAMQDARYIIRGRNFDTLIYVECHCEWYSILWPSAKIQNKTTHIFKRNSSPRVGRKQLDGSLRVSWSSEGRTPTIMARYLTRGGKTCIEKHIVLITILQ